MLIDGQHAPLRLCADLAAFDAVRERDEAEEEEVREQWARQDRLADHADGDLLGLASSATPVRLRACDEGGDR
ncbi:MAG: hypothetical protein WKF96_00025 [Solirubrobacteraceae bacterium]